MNVRPLLRQTRFVLWLVLAPLLAFVSGSSDLTRPNDVGGAFFNISAAWVHDKDGAVCPGDVDGDGEVDYVDLLDLLFAWGLCADCSTPQACPADLDGDCIVGVVDFLEVLTHWGPCP